MKPLPLSILAALVALTVGCDHSQDIPANASYKDPTGMDTKGAPGGSSASSMADQQAKGAQEQARKMQGRASGP